MNTKSIKTSVIILLIGALLSGGFFGYILSEVDRGEELTKLATYLPTTPTKLYDLNGVPFAELYRHRQELLRFQDIPPHVIHAFISVEDNNFYNHFGIDFKAIIRAGFINLIHLKVKQGGSTITQQLSKAILKNSKKSFTRKFIEALLTLQIEQEYSKEEILEIYFNLVYLGHGSTGLSTASTVYFSKDVQEGLAIAVQFTPEPQVTLEPFTSTHDLSQPRPMTLTERLSFLSALAARSDDELAPYIMNAELPLRALFASSTKMAIINQ